MKDTEVQGTIKKLATEYDGGGKSMEVCLLGDFNHVTRRGNALLCDGYWIAIAKASRESTPNKNWVVLQCVSSSGEDMLVASQPSAGWERLW